MSGKKAKKARKAQGTKLKMGVRVSDVCISRSIYASAVDAMFEAVLPNDKGEVHLLAPASGELSFEDAPVIARWSVGDTEILLCLTDESDPEQELIFNDQRYFRIWYRLSAADEGRWAVWQFSEAVELFEQMADIYDIAGLTPPLSARFSYPILAGDAIAFITGEEVAR